MDKREMPARSADPGGHGATLHRAWIATGLALAVTILLLGLLFRNEAFGAYRVWVESTAYNHSFLVLPIVAYMIWQRRALLAGLLPHPYPPVLLVIPLLSLFWLVALALRVLEGQQFIAMTIFQAVLLLALGLPIYRRLLGPLLYLYFLVPSGEFLVPSLQNLTARAVVHGLRLVGIPVYSDGIFIQVPAGMFVIAEACAGLRFLIASVAFGVFFSLVSYRDWRKRVAFVALSILVPIAANIVRVFGILLIAEIEGSATAVMADHIIYGWGFFAVVQICLCLIGLRFVDHASAAIVPRAHDAAALVTASPSRILLFLLLGTALAAIGPAYGSLLARREAAASNVNDMSPKIEAPWRRVTGDGDTWKPNVIGADHEFLETFTDGSALVRRFVAVYALHDLASNLVRDQNRIDDERLWRSSSTGRVSVRVRGSDFVVNYANIAAEGRVRLVWFFYVEDGVILASPLDARLRQARAILAGRSNLAAFVAISAAMLDPTDPPVGVLTQFLDAMEPMPEYLRDLTGTPKLTR